MRELYPLNHSCSQPAIAQLHKMQANLRLDESGIPAAPPAPPVPVATRPNAAVKKEDAGIQAKAEYDYEVCDVARTVDEDADLW